MPKEVSTTTTVTQKTTTKSSATKSTPVTKPVSATEQALTSAELRALAEKLKAEADKKDAEEAKKAQDTKKIEYKKVYFLHKVDGSIDWEHPYAYDPAPSAIPAVVEDGKFVKPLSNEGAAVYTALTN